MRVFVLTAMTMVAFAANSILNRMALAGGGIGPAEFAAIRLISGAAMLGLMALVRGGWRAQTGLAGPATLALYILGFSFAYVGLDAGVGALILFGGVQVTMFVGAVIGREAVPPRRWAGAAISLGGLGYLMWPAGGTAPDPVSAALMAAAALGWGLYSLVGRGARDPLGATAANFLWAVPAGMVAWALAPGGVEPQGVVLAMLSGAVTSGLGYALWYAVLPALGATRAAVAQLTVPVIAIAGGIVFLGEALSLRIALASVLVMSGIALSLSAGRKGR